ncbi:MAG: ATP-binding protein [Motiliproteus sp.]
MLKNYLKHRQENQLSYRLLVYILLCSTLLAILSTAIQLFWDYKKDLDDIQQGIESIEVGYLDSLASSLWKLDKEQISIQLDGIMKLPDIGFASITEIVADREESVFFRGDNSNVLPIQRSFELFYRDTLVGRLKVGATLDNVYQRLLQKFFIILGSQAIKTFFVSICILLIVHYLIVKQLNALALYTRRLGLDNLDEKFRLEPNMLRKGDPDALDQLSATLEQMQSNIRKQLNEKKKAQQALVDLNQDLEQRVKYRTATLKHTNDRLSETIEELTQTKDKLVETEKMAALGKLVSGIAYEIEKPVTEGLKSSEQAQQQLDKLSNSDESLSQLQQQNQHVHLQLQKMSELISAFRLISVDTHNISKQHIDLCKLVSQIEHNYSDQFETRNINFKLTCSQPLEIISYRDSWSQIFSQLIENSLRHGFKKEAQPDGGAEIEITLQRHTDQLRISYRDNGVGIPEPILPRLFEPFVASRSESGGSGLGTHVIYRLITDLLQGKIRCSSTRGKGTEFDIRIPLNPTTQPSRQDSNLW